jgi:uncharacterized phage protein (TIGR02218 family)
MRTIPIALAAHWALPTTSIAWSMTITRLDGEVFRFTSHDRDVTLASEVYASAPGLDIASLVHSAGLAVDNTEVTVLADDTIITRADIAAGVWDGAAFEIFQFNWADPTDGVAVRMAGTFGNLRPAGEAYVAELRDLRQPLQQDNTAVLQPTCRYRFCDARCTLEEGDFTHALEVTAVADNQEFTDSALAAATETFAEGEIRWLTGDNAGLRSKVRTEAAGVFELAIATVYDIQVGDTADLIEGCLHTRDACKAFSNILNFGGEPDKPTLDAIVAPAEPA